MSRRCRDFGMFSWRSRLDVSVIHRLSNHARFNDSAVLLQNRPYIDPEQLATLRLSGQAEWNLRSG